MQNTKLYRYLSALLVGLVVALLHVPAAGAAVLFMGVTSLVTDTAMQDAMKIYFSEPIVTNVVTDSELLDLFEQDPDVKIEETTGGRYIETAQMFKLPAGVGARADGDYIPIPSGPDIQNSKIFLKKIMGTVEMSADVMNRVQGDAGAYLNWLDRSLPSLVERVNHECDRMILGYGSGVKAQVASNVGAVVTLQNAFGISSPVAWDNAWLNFLEGETLVAGPNLNGTSLRNAGTPQTVTLVDQDNNKITLDALWTGASANDYIFAGDAAGVSTQDATGTDREFQGLAGMVDDGTIIATFQNIVRSSYTQWKAVVIDASTATWGGSLTEDLLVFADHETMVKGGGKVKVIVAGLSGQRSFWKSIKGDRVLNDPRNYAGGFESKGLKMFLGDRILEVRAARKMPPQLVYGLSPDTFKRHHLNQWEWDSTTGALWKQVTDSTGRKDAFYAYGRMYLNMSCSAPRKNFRIQGLTTTK